MSVHCSLEELSAYVDSELTEVELQVVGSHVERCPECRARVLRLEGIAGHVRRLERVSVPATLVPEIDRQVHLDRARRPLSSRIEEEVRRATRAPTLAPLFALVFAFSAILYLFSLGVSMRETSGTRMVIGGRSVDVSDTPGDDQVQTSRPGPERSAIEAAAPATAGGLLIGMEEASRSVAGRSFALHDGVWTEEEALGRAVDIVIDLAAGEEVPLGLEDLVDLPGVYRLVDGGRVVEIFSPAPIGG
jgi:hypothetical protein